MADNTIALNRKARFEYEITERFEAGIVLNGPEIKMVRAKKVDLSASYAKVLKDEAWLINMNISGAPEPTRTRKLLLHRSEIGRIIGLQEQKGLTLIPLTLYLKHGKAKIELGVGRGRKQHDKRELIKKRDIAREQKRGVK